MDVFRNWNNPLVSSLTSRIKATNDTKDRVAILVTALLPHLSGQDSFADVIKAKEFELGRFFCITCRKLNHTHL